ncbi:hypothetical protein Cfor_12872 [Coptotermes formosanus]|uniref:Endonuclease/exonuclease/phosphatase domain-containing protein n=1 Tax=Coptotermes formosanus TaxID=36987 RepID=A0A6L2PFI6_COPFO|nr:hypothetical protein Cfor_12872 [Coptotermes formosanus]
MLIKLNLESDAIDLTQYCIEKVIEACAVQIKVGFHSVILLCIYRSPSGNFGEFVEQLDRILKYLYKPKFELIICGDFNVNFLIDSSPVQQFILLIQSYNLFHIVDFPTRTTKGSSTAIDSIFIDLSRINLFQVLSLSNGLSDHEAQYLHLNNIFYCQSGNYSIVKKRLITNSAVSTFIELLKNESWDYIFDYTDVNQTLNLFLNTFLLDFESCFPYQYVASNISNNCWITTGIRISCKCKKFLYIMSKASNCTKIKAHYIRYCYLLRKVIRKAKEMYYNDMITSSATKSKTSWNIINSEIGTASNKRYTQTEFNLGSKTINVNQAAKTFNNYFINSVAELITQDSNSELALSSLRGIISL